MNVTRKDATITNTDEDFPGSFEVILSAPTLDRDGDTYLPDEWKMPLPDHITFDIDHGLSVSSTVGSGTPYLHEDGTLRVKGTYSSLARAQEVRTLVGEGHINKTSVAVLNRTTKSAGGERRVERELLNGSFVAVPANRDAVILSSKGLNVKDGRRNSAADQVHIDAIARHAVALGATIHSGGDTDADEDVAAGKSLRLKAVAGSYEQRQQAINDALDAAYQATGPDAWVYAYALATFADTVVYRVSGDSTDVGQWQASYTLNSDGTVTLGEPARVNLVEQILPIEKSYRLAKKDADVADPAAMIQQIDAALDQIPTLLDGIDVDPLPAAVQQALSLAQAAGAVVDELMDALGIPDPDEEADTAAEPDPAAAAKAAAAGTGKTAAEDDSIDPLMAARKRFYATLTGRN